MSTQANLRGELVIVEYVCAQEQIAPNAKYKDLNFILIFKLNLI